MQKLCYIFSILFIFVYISYANNTKKYATKAYWLEALQGKVTDYGYFQDIAFLFVANKKTPKLTLFKINHFALEHISTTTALVAKGKGYKQKKGDLTTPIGTYRINNRFTKLDQYYGALALSTTYPNAYDTSLQRTGSGIWIHGMPLNGNRSEQYTRGCVVIENNILSQYDAMINWRKTLAIIYEHDIQPTNINELALLLASLHAWRDALQANNLSDFIQFYDKNFKTPKGKPLEYFIKSQKEIFAKKQARVITLSPIDIAIYPHNTQKKLFVLYFIQHITKEHLGKKQHIATPKELYVSLDDGVMRIISER